MTASPYAPRPDHRPYPFVSRPVRAPAPDRPVQRTLEEAIREDQNARIGAPLETPVARDPARHAVADALAPRGRPPAAPVTIEQRFWAFHRAHPGVFTLLVHYARQAKARGARRIGIRMLWERVRWEVEVEARDPSGFKLNDQFTSRYSRLIAERNQFLRDLFQTRTLRSVSEIWPEDVRGKR